MILTDPDDIRLARNELRLAGRSVVLTNGVFDLLHIGHLRYLQSAATLGDTLWVALNSDQSVQRLKGEGRPLLPWPERAALVEALKPVSAVLFFDELTADRIIRIVLPDVYVKGGDYSEDTLPELTTVRDAGAQLAFIPYVEGRSTTSIIENILRNGNTLMHRGVGSTHL